MQGDGVLCDRGRRRVSAGGSGGPAGGGRAAGGVVYGLSEVYGLGRPAPEEYQPLFAGGLRLCSGTRLDAWLDGRPHRRVRREDLVS